MAVMRMLAPTGPHLQPVSEQDLIAGTRRIENSTHETTAAASLNHDSTETESRLVT